MIGNICAVFFECVILAALIVELRKLIKVDKKHKEIVKNGNV